MAIPENDNQLWKGFGHGLYSKRAERDVDGLVIDQTYAKKADVPALDTVLSDSSTTAITPNAVKDAIEKVDVIPTLPQNPSSLYSESQGSLAWGGWETEEMDVPNKELYYHTDFSQFNVSTGIDIPIVGQNSNWTIQGNVTKTTKTIDGVDYSALYVPEGGRITMSQDLLTQFPDVFSVEATVYKNSFSGLAGGCSLFCVNVPEYNCYEGDRGISVWPYRGSVVQTFNGFRMKHDGYYYSDYYNATNVRQIITGGVTVFKTQNTVKAYLAGKKSVVDSVNPSDSDVIAFYADNQYGSDYYVLDVKIYTTNRFDEMDSE